MKSKSALHLPASATAKPRRILAALLVPLVAALFPVATAHAQTVTSAVPGFISYQGKVSNAAGALVGAGTPVNRTVIFRIWSHPGNSTVNDLVYAEQQTVTISEGEFSVLIGQGSVVSGTPLGYSEAAKGPPTTTVASAAVFGGATRYLGVTIDDPSASADPEISPRQQLVTSAYAFRAKYAETVGANGVNSLTALDNGNVGIGTANPGARLEVNGSIRAGGAGTPTAALSLLANSNSQQALSIGYSNSVGTFSTDAAAGDTVIRTENGGKLLLQTGTGASALSIGANNYVGIGTSTPATLLDVRGGSPAITVGTAAGNEGSVYFGNNSHGVRRNFNNVPNNVGLYTTSGDVHLSASGQNTNHLVVKADGKVGIGTNNPSTNMEVQGHINITGAMRAGGGFTFWGSGDHDGGVFSPADGTITINTNNAERMRITPGGLVGIGTNAPGTALHVVGSNPIITVGTSSGGLGGIYLGNVNHGVVRGYNGVSNDVALYTTQGSVILGASAGANHLIVRNSGRVGIGHSDPQAPLYVSGLVNMNLLVEANGHQAGWFDVGNQNLNQNIGLWVEQTIRANHYVVQSDARIKNIVGRSSGAADLGLLQQIEITDYTFKDPRIHGTGAQKKVIAQQVEKIFPQAVTQLLGVLPDIMKSAEIADGWVNLATDLRRGERVRLIANGREAIEEVLEVEPNRFRTAFKPEAAEVMVYGREVKDFRTVDYEAIAMLNVSATQELKRQHDAEVAALHAANASLTQRVSELEARDRVRDTKLAAIEKLLSSGQLVMARPASSTTGNASGQE